MTLIDGPRLPPARGGAAKSLVIFLHGYGADGNDLIGLGREWSGILPETAFVSPHAPEACAMSPAGRQWFDLTLRDPSEYKRGVTAARPELDAFLDAEMARAGVGPERTALVGFSQGTMMALHTGLLRPSPLAGILGYSGLLADPGALTDGAISRAPVLLIHGDRDDAIARLQTLPSTRRKRVQHDPTHSFQDIVRRVTFHHDLTVMEADFSHFTFNHSRDVNDVYDYLEDRIKETNKKWFFLVNLEGCQILPAAWVQYAHRGKQLNIAASLGSVRFAPGSETERDIRMRAESQDFNPNLRNTREEALARIAEMRAALVADLQTHR